MHIPAQAPRSPEQAHAYRQAQAMLKRHAQVTSALKDVDEKVGFDCELGRGAVRAMEFDAPFQHDPRARVCGEMTYDGDKVKSLVAQVRTDRSFHLITQETRHEFMGLGKPYVLILHGDQAGNLESQLKLFADGSMDYNSVC